MAIRLAGKDELARPSNWFQHVEVGCVCVFAMLASMNCGALRKARLCRFAFEMFIVLVGAMQAGQHLHVHVSCTCIYLHQLSTSYCDVDSRKPQSSERRTTKAPAPFATYHHHYH